MGRRGTLSRVPRLDPPQEPRRAKKWIEWTGHPGWSLSFNFVAIEGELICDGMGIQSPGNLPVSARTMRLVDWVNHADRARRELVAAMDWAIDLHRQADEMSAVLGLSTSDPEDVMQFGFWRDHASRQVRSGRQPRLGEAHYREVA